MCAYEPQQSTGWRLKSKRSESDFNWRCVYILRTNENLCWQRWNFRDRNEVIPVTETLPKPVSNCNLQHYNLTHTNGDASLSLVIIHTKIRCSLWISLMAEREHERCNEEVLMTEYNSVACRDSNISSTISFFHSFCSTSKVWMDLMSSSVWLFGLLMLASKQHRWIIQRFTFTQVNIVSNIIYLIHQHLKIVSHLDGGQVPLL